ncbi:hypothetical protein N9955_00720 [bacterium]|nr:hypothetical protein [bacterium]
MNKEIELRDYFAGQALASVLGLAIEDGSKRRKMPEADEFRQSVAAMCYNMADSMLEEKQEREKNENN